jgi:eukaryotic-like serine/threonine-protein kinase
MMRCTHCQLTSTQPALLCASCGHVTMNCDDPRAGTQIDGFTVLGCIATNHRASVYLAVTATEKVALKLYHECIESIDHTRFVREVQAQARAVHPAIAALRGSGQLANGQRYLASEWIAGVTLEQSLDNQPIDWAAAAAIIDSMSAGLAVVHANAIVHRDLKPSNIVLRNGDPTAAVMLDFGHALLQHDPRATESGMVLGSAAYMSPEQARGEKLDGRSDLYALGVILYQCLTGLLPHQGISAPQMLLAQLHSPVVSPSTRVPHLVIPREIEDLCMWLLAKDRAARVPNTHVLSAMLRAMRATATPAVNRPVSVSVVGAL